MAHGRKVNIKVFGVVNELTKKWMGQYTDSLVSLYEFKNKTTNEVYYSANTTSKMGYIKTDLPISEV